MKKYRASLDRLAWVITIGTILLLGAGAYTSVNAMLRAQHEGSAILIHIVALFLFVLIVPGTWLFAPRAYSISGNALVIHRPASKSRIAISDIASVRTLGKSEMRGSIRTFGVGGLFGYYGKFSAPQLGSLQLYVSRMDNLLLLTLRSGELIVISPDNAGLESDLKEKIR